MPSIRGSTVDFERTLYAGLFAAAQTYGPSRTYDAAPFIGASRVLAPSSSHSGEPHAAFRHSFAYFDEFTKNFFSAHGALLVTEAQRSAAIALCQQSAQHAALACMDAFATTDFREDLKKVTVPTLVIHGDADAIVPIEGSGQRTHRAITHSKLVTVNGAPHGLNLSHAKPFNDALLAFLQ